MSLSNKPLGYAQPLDKNLQPVQVAGNIRCRDGAGTPKESPQTVSTSTTTLTVPTGAVSLSMLATAADLRFGDNATLDGTTDEGYDFLPQDSRISIDVSNKNSVYVVRDAGVNVTLYFHFAMLGDAT